MFYEIDGKIRLIGVITFFYGIISSFVVGIRIIDLDYVKLGISVIIGGIISTFVIVFILFGVAQLVENTEQIAQNTKKQNQQTNYEKPLNEYYPKNVYERKIENNSREEINEKIPLKQIGVKETKNENKVKNIVTIEHRWRCDNCGNMIESYPCKYCGKGE